MQPAKASGKQASGHGCLLPVTLGDLRTGLTVADLKQSFLDTLFCTLGRVSSAATPHDLYTALALAIRDRVLKHGVQTLETYHERDARVVAYLSAEYLPGPHLANNLLNLGIWEQTRQAVEELGCNLDFLMDQEEEPGLGNGGLGRLASCFMDSLASLEVPAVGYGLRYEFGIFDQAIRDGGQVESTDKWLRYGNPWEIVRPELTYEVKLGGHTEAETDEQGRYRVRWVPARVVQGIAYDTPILGYRVGTCNRCACGRRRPSSRSTSPRSTTVIITGPSRTRWHRKTSPRCFTRMMRRFRARTSALSSNSSS
jgi:starch phosphorylase